MKNCPDCGVGVGELHRAHCSQLPHNFVPTGVVPRAVNPLREAIEQRNAKVGEIGKAIGFPVAGVVPRRWAHMTDSAGQWQGEVGKMPVKPLAYADPYSPPTPSEAVNLAGGIRPGAVMFADPIQQAVDDYLLMERKARAWDWLVEHLPSADAYKTAELLACMHGLVHPAQEPNALHNRATPEGANDG